MENWSDILTFSGNNTRPTTPTAPPRSTTPSTPVRMPAQPAPIAPMLAQPGHQADLQMINALVEQLCTVNETNRREMDKLIKEVEEVRTAHCKEMEDKDPGIAMRAELQDLRNRLSKSSRKVESLKWSYRDLEAITDEYDAFVTGVMNMTRFSMRKYHNGLLNWHKYYQNKCQELRDENLQLRLEHQSWQEALGRAAELARGALREQNREQCPLKAKIAGQRRQIICMRRLLGWVGEEWEFLDSDDEEEVKEEEEEGIRRDMERLQLENEERVVARGRPAESARGGELLRELNENARRENAARRANNSTNAGQTNASNPTGDTGRREA